MKKVDINVDIGEGFPYDEDLLDFATSANICCGVHAGSWELTKETLYLCERKGARIGIHPGFPDRESMGRARMKRDEVAQYSHSILEQVLQFWEYSRTAAYLKPHGAWSNMLTDRRPPDSALFQACCLMLEGAMAATALPVMMLAGSPVLTRLESSSTILEGYADRAYEPDGSLRPRAFAGAVLDAPECVRAQVLALAPKVDSICIHGDTKDCVQFAKLVYETLESAGFEVGY